MLFATLIDFEDCCRSPCSGCSPLAWWVLDRMAAAAAARVERLDELKNPALRRRKSEDEQGGVVKKSDAMTRVLAKASPALAKPLQPKSEVELNKLKPRLAHAGFRGEAAPRSFSD